MSIVAKVVFGSACMFSIGIISYVHFRQKYDRDKLHEGVIKDVERQQQRKIENIFLLQQQIELTKQLRNATDNNQNEHTNVR